MSKTKRLVDIWRITYTRFGVTKQRRYEEHKAADLFMRRLQRDDDVETIDYKAVQQWI